MMDAPTHGLLATSLFATLLLAIFLPLRPLLRAAIGSQWLCFLWLALLMRLLLPWPLETRWGLMNAWDHAATSPAPAEGPLKIKVSYSPDAPGNEGRHPAAAAPAAAPMQIQAAPSRLNIPLLIWMSGFVATLALLALRRYQTARLAARTAPATDRRLLAIFSSIPARWRSNVELRMSGAVHVPTLAGIWRPQIWMPETWPAQFSDDELRAILLHELGHARRGDLAAQWLFALAQCLHWFNPLVWMAGRAARLDRELACDAWVLSRDLPSPAYGETLLKTARMLRTPVYAPAATVAMASGRRSLRARIAGIGGYRRAGTWPGVIGIALMVVALAIGTTSRTTVGQTPGPTVVAKSSPLPVVQPEASPAASASANAGGPEIKLEAKFVEIEIASWKKLRAEDADFREATAALGDADAITSAYRAPSDKAPDDAQLAALKALGSDNWIFKDGAWQNVTKLTGMTVLSDKEFEKMLRSLDGCKGVDLLSAPRVTTRSGQQAMIEIVREYHYPSEFEPFKKSPSGWSATKFTTQNIGVSLGVKATYESTGNLANTIDMDLNPELADFLGFLPEKNGGKIEVGRMHAAPGYWRPIFSISRGETELNMLPGQTVVLAGVKMFPKSEGADFGEEPPKREMGPDSMGRLVVMVFVTPTIVTANGLPAGTPADADAKSAPPLSAADAKLPYATPVPGKAGFVLSPFVPSGGYVDVRGLPKDTKVKDPYTGKMFLVP